MSARVCAVCFKEQKNSSLQIINESIEHLLRKHLYITFSTLISSYTSNICTNCKTNLYKLDKSDEVPRIWLETLQKVIQV